jgi:DNA-binding MarR family transcriptional regulator
VKALRTDERIMLYLAEHQVEGPDALTQRAIASGVGKDPSNISKGLKELEAEGYVSKFIYTNRGNHRYTVLIYGLTEQGVQMVAALAMRRLRS